MGDDEFVDCAQEGLQIDILPRMTLSPPPFYPSHTDLLQKRKRLPKPPVHRSLPPAAADSPPRRNEKHLAQTRPLVHLPPRLLHVSYWDCVGNRMHHFYCGHRAPHPAVCFCTFSCRFAPRGHRCLLSSGEASRPWHCGTTGAQKTTGFIYASGRGGTVGVWILF